MPGAFSDESQTAIALKSESRHMHNQADGNIVTRLNFRRYAYASLSARIRRMPRARPFTSGSSPSNKGSGTTSTHK
eukprot:744843-Prorocentrum_minimum.AAC.1